jgi:uncharacterized membrane protein
VDSDWIVHLYRGFVQTATMWRQRMDVTANWAVPLLIGLATFAFGDPALPHFLYLLLGSILIAFAITIEVRRYRELSHATWRAYLIEAGWFAPLLSNSDVDSRWRTDLANDLCHPRAPLPMGAAILARMRRTYLVLVYVLIATWIAKVALHPRPVASAVELLDRMRLGPIPGAWLAAMVVALLAVLTVLTAISPKLSELERSTSVPRRRDRDGAGGKSVSE